MEISEWSKVIWIKDRPNHFPTVCDEKDAVIHSDEPSGIGLRYQEYDAEATAAICAQAREWQFRVHSVEDWDTMIHPNGKRIEKDSFAEIDPDQILVADGKFVGVFCVSYGLGGQITGRCVLVNDYCGKPIYCFSVESYGSSDRDVLYDTLYYLVKK